MKNNDMKMLEESRKNGFENLQISEETREKLEEATVSLFMEQYAKAMDAGIDIMMEECADDEFPEELDKRIRALIAKESTKERKAKCRKTALRVLRSAAAVFAVMLLTCSVLFVTVEAFRLPIMNFFVDKTDLYWEISSEDKNNDIPDVFNEKDPLGDILSEEFELVYRCGSFTGDNFVADYENSKDQTVSLCIVASGGSNQTDSEDADASYFDLLGYDAMLSTEGNLTRITWIDYDMAKVFTIYSINVLSDEVINIAAKFAYLF